MLNWPNGYEVFGNGQSLYKEPTGGHPKLLHQDSAYFQHRYQGPVAILSYVVDTNLTNGALYVVPKSHLLGQLNHIDTFSHLGLAPEEWGWEDALPLEGQAGDSIFFHVQAIHGSKQNFSDRPHVRSLSIVTAPEMTKPLLVVPRSPIELNPKGVTDS